MQQGKSTTSHESNRKRASEVTQHGKQTDDGQKVKRMRVSRACDQCRAGREKCDGAQPRCQTCQTQKRTCSYNEPPKKRGIQPHYIRTLELTLAWIFKTFPSSESRLANLIPDFEGAVHSILASKDAAASDDLHAVWRNSLVCRQIDQLLSGSEIEVPTPSALPQDASEISYQSPPLSVPSDLNLASLDVSESILATREDDNVTARDKVEIVEANVLALPGNSWALLEHYFAFIHAWFPITEKHDVLKLMYSYPSGGLPRNQAVSAEHAELWSIMTLAQVKDGAPGSPTGNSERNRAIARSLIPSEHEHFEIGHVKALLILCLVEMAKGSWLAAWLLVGSSIRVLTYVGTSSETSTADSRYNRTLLAAFLLESAIASRNRAQILHLQPAQIESIGPLVEDGLEEWSPWSDPDPAHASLFTAQRSPARSISTFNTLIRRAMRFQQATDFQSPSRHKDLDILFDLLTNASAHQGRRQPSVIVAEDALAARPVNENHHVAGANATRTTSSNNLANSHIGFANAAHAEVSKSQPFPFLSMADEVPASFDDSLPQSWNAELDKPQDLTGDIGTDIFEELALLERTDSSSHPHFMQNLGFGPDVDLAEFFGADYQPSDPMLAYVQPSTQSLR